MYKIHSVYDTLSGLKKKCRERWCANDKTGGVKFIDESGKQKDVFCHFILIVN